MVLSLLVVLAQLARVRTGQPETDSSAGWVGGVVVVLALGSGLVLLWRRRRPLVVAGTVLACYGGLALIDGLAAPYAAWVMVWSLATSGGDDRRRSVVLASVTAAATSVLLVVAELRRPGTGALALLVAITALVLLTGVLVRSERSRVEAVGRRAATEERLRIARDLHDLVGHGLSSIAVQSGTARMALQAGDEAAAGSALAAVESSSRTALREMRQMLGVLTAVDDADSVRDRPDETEGGPRPAPNMDDLGPLVDNVRAGGQAVTLEQTGNWTSASSGVQLVIYRLVQEGLTNAVKHAPGSLVTVRLHAADGVGRVSVETVGSSVVADGSPAGGGQGLGLDGLRTRVEAVSGDFRCGATGEGWLIEARVPLNEEGVP